MQAVPGGEEVLEETTPVGADGIRKSLTVMTGLGICGNVSPAEVDTIDIVVCMFWKFSKSSITSASTFISVSGLML